MIIFLYVICHRGNYKNELSKKELVLLSYKSSFMYNNYIKPIDFLIINIKARYLYHHNILILSWQILKKLTVCVHDTLEDKNNINVEDSCMNIQDNLEDFLTFTPCFIQNLHLCIKCHHSQTFRILVCSTFNVFKI